MSSTRRHLEHLARGGALGAAGAAAAALGGFGLTAIITNGFDATTAGTVFTASSLFVIAHTVSQLGTDVGLGRFVLRYAAESRTAAIHACLATSFRGVLMVSMTLGLALAVTAPAISDIIGLTGSYGANVVRAFALALPLSATGAVALAATRAFSDIRPTVALNQLGRSLTQPIFVIIVILAGGGVVALSTAWVLPYVLTATIAGFLLHRLMQQNAPRDPTATPLLPSSRKKITREFWSFTWPRSLGAISQIVIQRIDIIIIAALTSPADAAVYTAATRFVVLGKFVVTAIQQVVQPQFTHLLAARQRTVLRDVFKTSTAWSIVAVWPIYLVIGGAPHVYLSLFGSGFGQRGAITVVVLMVAMLVSTYAGPADTLLLMSGRSLASLINSLVALSLDLGLCFLLIPSFGIAGAAAGWASSLVARNMLAYALVYRSLKLSPASLASTIAAAAGVVCFGIPMLIIWKTGNDDLMTFIVVASIGALCYAGILWLARKPLRLRVLRGIARRRLPATITE